MDMTMDWSYCDHECDVHVVIDFNGEKRELKMRKPPSKRDMLGWVREYLKQRRIKSLAAVA